MSKTENTLTEIAMLDAENLLCEMVWELRQACILKSHPELAALTDLATTMVGRLYKDRIYL